MDIDELRYRIKRSSLTSDSISAMPNSGKPQSSSSSGNILPQTIIHSLSSQETRPSSSRDATQDMTFNEYIQWHHGSAPGNIQVPESRNSSSTITAFPEAVGGQQPENSESSTEVDSISSEHSASGESPHPNSHPCDIASTPPNSISTNTNIDNSAISSKPTIPYIITITIYFLYLI